jgi:DNA-binding transcriptional ArsR family regulator
MIQPVWKLCRVLANQTRLDILRHLLNGMELCVCDIALEHDLTRPSASKHIRLLAEYGFLETKPSGKWLLCRTCRPTKEDPLYDLWKALSKKLRADESQRNEIYRSVTAFTHERRGCIIRLLQEKSLPLEQLVSASDISAIALNRHLEKLISRGLVAENGNIYRFTPPSDPILKSLLKLLLHS